MENVTKSIITTLGSSNYPNPTNKALNLYENLIVLKYWKSKKLFKKKLNNVLLKKKFNTPFQISNQKFNIPSNFKKLIFKTNNTTYYIKTRKNLNKSVKFVSVMNRAFNLNRFRNTRTFVTHPYFINFETDLHKSFWTFLGTPLFDIYFQRTIYATSQEAKLLPLEDDVLTSKFYLNGFKASKKNYNINYLLKTLTKINEYEGDLGVENIDIDTESLEQCDDDDYEESIFRVHFDGDQEDEEEDIEEVTSTVDTILDVPYLFLKTVHQSFIDFDVEDYVSFSLLEFVSVNVEDELELENEENSTNSNSIYLENYKKDNKNKSTAALSRADLRNFNYFNTLKIFKNNTCKEFYINFTTYKNSKKETLPITLDSETDFWWVTDIECEYSFASTRSSIFLELLVTNHLSVNYLNIKYKFLTQMVSKKLYQNLREILSLIDKTKKTSSTPVRRIVSYNKKLSPFKTYFNKMKPIIKFIEKKIKKIKNLKLLKPVKSKKKIKTRQRLVKLTYNTLLNRFVRRFLIRHNLISKIYKQFINKKFRNKKSKYKIKYQRYLSSFRTHSKKTLFSDLKLKKFVLSEKQLNLQKFINELTSETMPKGLCFTLLNTLNLTPSIYSLYSSRIKKKINKSIIKNKIKNILYNLPIKTFLILNNKKSKIQKHTLINLHIIKNQLLSKKNFYKIKPNLALKQHKISLKYFSQLDLSTTSDDYLNDNIDFLTTYYDRFNLLKSTKQYFKNYNRKLVTDLHTENYFSNFFTKVYSFNIHSNLENDIELDNVERDNKFDTVSQNNSYVVWLAMQMSFYSRLLSNYKQELLFHNNFKLVTSSIKNDDYNKFNFFKIITTLNLLDYNEDSFEVNNSTLQNSIKPFFTTKFNNTFILGTYGFYLKQLPTDQTLITTTLLRSYLHGIYSFVDPLPLKKNLLKSFLLKKEYHIDENSLKEFYDTFGFNFYAINNTLASTNVLNNCNPLKKNNLSVVDSPFYNEDDEFEHEPDKSLRIKYKPGYSIIWRRMRSLFKEVFHLKYKYQHRLTTHLFKYENNLFKYNLYQKTDNTIMFMLIRSKFAYDMPWSVELLDNNYVFINSFVVNNPQTTLIKGDFVQLLVHIKYYTMMKWRHGLSFLKKTRANKFAKRKFKPKDAHDGASRNYRYPDWILKLRHYEGEVPAYVEIDFFTLSFFVIYNPYVEIHRQPYVDYIGIPKVVRLYNWKYIN